MKLLQYIFSQITVKPVADSKKWATDFCELTE